MDRTIYVVRALSPKGELIRKEAFRREGKYLDFVRAQVEKNRKVVVRSRIEEAKFTIEDNSVWGISGHTPYEVAPGPLRTIFIHTSVTKQLEAFASVKAERAEMRNVDRIAHGRGFNGFSYNFGVLPSGRAYEGRGFRVVEAATEDYNTTADSIVTIGNTDVFDPTEAQVLAIIGVIKEGQRRGHYAKKLEVFGHRKVAAKACPGAKFRDATIRRIEVAVNG